MRRHALAAAALVTVLAVGAARLLAGGERAMAESDAALARGDTRTAIAAARRAAEAFLPGSPYPRRGFERLARIANDAEARLDTATAAAAWRAARAAAEETRAPFGSATAEWRDRANAGLVHAAGADVGQRAAPSAAPSATLAEDVAREHGPTSWEILLLSLAGLAFYATGARFLRPKHA